jgi:SAM-dependent methyltransferase
VASFDETWESHAEWWQAGFTAGADPEYEEQILPLVERCTDGCQRVLDVGAGEGQVARRLRRSGDRLVVGVEPARAQLATAGRREGGVAYVGGTADALPVREGTFDAVVACLVFEHIDDVDAAIAEVSRALAPGGRFVLLLNHPLLQTPGSGWIDDQVLDPPEQYWRVGPYLPEAESVEQVEPGVHIRFLHRPLHRYVNAMAAVGLHIVEMIEPPPPEGFLALAPEYREAATIPRLLVLVTSKV